MAEEGLIIRGIHWRRTFPFINIFRSFRIAIHPSKLALGLVLLLTVYTGGRILDFIWPQRSKAVPAEIAQYEKLAYGSDQGSLSAWRDGMQQSMEAHYADQLINYQIIPANESDSVDNTRQRALDAARDHLYMGKTKDAIIKQRDQIVTQLNEQYDVSYKAAQDAYTAKPEAPDAIVVRNDTQAQALIDLNNGIAKAYDRAAAECRSVDSLKGEGLFSSFFSYEVRQVTGVVEAVGRNSWLDTDGVIAHVENFFSVGPVWLIWHHTVFFILFTIVFLFAWSVFGGAISRIAAVHVARDEKIPIRQAMNFSVGKLLSFASAPIIPIVIVLVIGLIVAVASLIGCIPFLGPIAIGAFFFLALLAGFAMTLVLLGTAGGFNLMYPTISVEGTDSFDAISRSISYVYAQPWRMLFYTAVAIVYGAITYMFVHVFIWMMLSMAHHFVGMGMLTSAANTRDLFSVMWPGPTANGRLTYHVDWTALSFGQKIGAALLQFWIMLLVSFLGAFAISLYFCSNTVIYYLIRFEVDATEMEEVYIEQPEDELGPMAPTGGFTPAEDGATERPRPATPTSNLGETMVITPPDDVPPPQPN